MTWNRTAQASTTARGYGRDHQREAERRRKTLTPADPCGYCGRPLGPERLPGDRASRWQLPHNRQRTVYLPGMWHASCNLREGAIEGNRRAALKRARQRPTPRNWFR